MKREGRRAGLGGVLFAASLAVGFTLFGPKGGQYSAAEVAAFVAQGATALIVSVYLVVVAISRWAPRRRHLRGRGLKTNSVRR